jgi:hypothetical protein
MGRRGRKEVRRRERKGKETNHVPVSSLQQVFAAVTKGRSVVANVRKSVESCILDGNSK